MLNYAHLLHVDDFDNLIVGSFIKRQLQRKSEDSAEKYGTTSYYFGDDISIVVREDNVAILYVEDETFYGKFAHHFIVALCLL